MWVMVAQRKGAADTMAGLIDYGMRAGGIAERKKGCRTNETNSVWAGGGGGNVWRQSNIHAQLEPPKERKRKRV